MSAALIVWWLVISVVAAVLTVWDKRAAKRHRRRIPEATLLWVGLLGGAESMLLMMKLIRHKTHKPKFMIGLPLCIALHIAAVVVWLWIKGAVII